MASFEDYDEFGNYIGADLDSDEEEDNVQQNDFTNTHVEQPAPLAGYDDDPMDGQSGALMEIDGIYRCSCLVGCFKDNSCCRTCPQRGNSP